MRLKKIKLAGFKSFVDVATVPVDKNLVGIVGPNGCGKSNVIDAVRWVMGESSAKQLRGDSMTDVIFNGASSRKPVSQASIELVFDNSLNKLGGQYAQYSEIAIKRIINREGNSNYYFNNTKCRRKDLQDLFLGTGLGPRSYTIIEQGMISRIIEAKPEELRVYLEEAAGISKYKERRRETENRIKHTRENLERVNDIVVELTKQLEKLARQSEVAEKYKVLKQELTCNEEYNLGLQYKQLNSDYQDVTSKVNNQTVFIEDLNSKIENLNLIQEKKRIEVGKLQQEQQAEQATFYKFQQNISNIEQEIKHQESEKSHTLNNLKNIEKQISYCSNNLDTKKTSLEQVQAELIEIEPEHEAVLDLVSEKKEALKSTEQELASWDKQWSQQQENLNTNSKTISQSQALIEKHETLIIRSQKRLEILKQEQQQLKEGQNTHHIVVLKDKIEQITELENIKHSDLEAATENYEQYEQKIDELQDELNEKNNEQQAKKGRLASLKTLQEAALGKDQKSLNDWLAKNNLTNCSRLGEVINIESGWEKALETILKDYLKAIVLPNDKSLADYDLLDAELAKQNTAFLCLTHENASLSQDNSLATKLLGKYDLLINKISAPKQIALLLNNIYCVDSIEEARNCLPSLKYYESIITKDGIWHNNNWFTYLSTNKSNSDQSIIAREQEIKELQVDIDNLDDEIIAVKQELVIKKSDLDELKENKENLQKEIRTILHNSSEIKSQISREESKLEEQRNRLFKIEQDISECIKHVESDSVAVRSERSKLEKAMLAMEELSLSKEELQLKGDELKSSARNTRTEFDQLKDKLHKSELHTQKLKQQDKHLRDEISRLEKQYDRLNSEQQDLLNKLNTFDEPIAKLHEELDFYLDKKQIQEVVLTEKNQGFELANQDLLTFEKEINQLRKEHENCRDQIEDLRIRQHEYSTRLASVNDQIQEKELDIAKLTESMPNDLNQSVVRAKIKDLRQNIDSLGPVNLTAIEEYNIEAERKNYLDAQHNDLIEALTALEDAIAQIDEETKSRFRDTFDAVNEQFQYLFPKIFAGGRATLTLSGEDLLDTGVSVMAQPPGKRNASIHLLSGGEKALTAIALVFAIFRLNPAPFCMLDEVDAPLDDANVARYCNIVKEMSKDIQFIFITHNKVAMTMAEHLIGVTQNEPGVSRLVAVDLDEAAKLAEM